MKRTLDYPAAFVSELQQNSGAMLRVAAVLGSLAFMLLFLVDPLLTSGADLMTASVFRIAAISILMGLFAASFHRPWVQRAARPATLTACLLTGGTVITLNYLTGGGASRYHEALYVTMFGYAVLPVPWRRWDAPLAFTALFIGYDVVMLAGSRPGPWGDFATTNSLLAASVVVASVLHRIIMTGRIESYLARNDLANANTRLQALDEAKSRFFANLSHELRTPLTLTLAPLDALLESDGREPLSEGQLEKLRLAQRNALRLLRLVDDLLALTKAEAASLRLELGEVDPVALITGFADDVRGLTARKQIDLQIALEPELPTLVADEHLVERVLLNLVGNAAKFTPEGGRITVSVRPRDRGIELAVSDTGIGIAAEHLPHIFDRFYQADSGSTRRVGGTGIGLALVKEIVALHEGRVEAESAVGVGTTLRCWFPLVPPGLAAQDAPGAPKAGAVESASVPDQGGLPEWHQAIRRARSYRLQGIDDATERRVVPRPRPKGHAPTVLVVEDNPDMIRFIAALLASDYNVLSAQNGRDGLRLALARRPDLIISDVMMPEMNGFEMLDALRASPAAATIPLIFLTARGSAEDRVTGRLGGAETYLAKPFRSEELLAAVDALLTRGTTLNDQAKTQQDEALVYMASGVVDAIRGALAGREDECGEAVTALRRLAAELSGFAHAGARPVEAPAPVDEVVRSVLQSLAGSHPGRTLHAILDAPGAVALEPDEVAGIVKALVVRALSVSPGHAAVEVATERLDGHEVVIEVRDRGPSVTPDEAERLFFAFDGAVGDGLGLALQRRIVTARGGALHVVSREGSGTCITARLPASPNAAEGAR